MIWYLDSFLSWSATAKVRKKNDSSIRRISWFDYYPDLCRFICFVNPISSPGRYTHLNKLQGLNVAVSHHIVRILFNLARDAAEEEEHINLLGMGEKRQNLQNYLPSQH